MAHVTSVLLKGLLNPDYFYEEILQETGLKPLDMEDAGGIKPVSSDIYAGGVQLSGQKGICGWL